MENLENIIKGNTEIKTALINLDSQRIYDGISNYINSNKNAANDNNYEINLPELDEVKAYVELYIGANSSEYELNLKNIKHQLELNTNDDPNAVQQYLTAENNYLNYLKKNDKLHSLIAMNIENSSLESKLSLEESKHDAIKSLFKTPEEYLAHLQEGFNGYNLQVEKIMKTFELGSAKEEEILTFRESSLNFLQTYSSYLIQEAEHIYNIKINIEQAANDENYGSNSDANNNSKAA